MQESSKNQPEYMTTEKTNTENIFKPLNHYVMSIIHKSGAIKKAVVRKQERALENLKY